MTVGTPSSTMATHELVVPRSMPMTRSILLDAPSSPAIRRDGASLTYFSLGMRLLAELGRELFDARVVRRDLERAIDLARDALLEPGRHVRARERDVILG